MLDWLAQNYQWIFDGIGGGICVLIIGLVIKALFKKRKSTIEVKDSSFTHSLIASGFHNPQTVNAPTIIQVGSLRGDIQAPELVIEYSDSEGAHNDPNTKWPASLGRDIKIRNLSKDNNAYNLEVKDLVTPDGSAVFAPSVIAFIPVEGEAEVSPHVRDVSPIVRHSLASLFAKSYKDSSTDELMGENSYWLTMEYDDVNGNRFEVKCELLYRHWKRIVRTGRVKRRRLLEGFL